MNTLLEKAGGLLYLVSPNATSFSDAALVPNYVHEAVPLMTVLMFLEMAARWGVGRKVRLNETVSNFAVGLLHETAYLLTGWITLAGYEWLYQYRVWDLPWDSYFTWIAAWLLVDFCFYWIHRANHELNLLWAIHQIHHSSEDFNLTIAVRLSVFQRASHFGFYHPLALLGFPLSTIVVHTGFNFLFQFWVHSDFVGNLGPLEWVFMTPSHHRVHHGANKWCLDKNYGSVFVVWDRIFGTFEGERTDSEIVYGLVEQPQVKNVLWHEFFSLERVVSKALSMTTWTNSLKAVFYGPGWTPGAPRLGDPDTFPDVRAPRPKHDPQLPTWQGYYGVSHLLLLLLTQQMLVVYYKTASWSFVTLWLSIIITGAGVLSAMYDDWRWVGVVEAVRCTIFAVAVRYVSLTTSLQSTFWGAFYLPPVLDDFVFMYLVLSALLWGARETWQYKIKEA